MNNLKELTNEEIIELINDKKVFPKDLTDSGICPTCFDKENNGILYGDNTKRLIYEDDDFLVLLIPNPRCDGHTIISSKKHYKDMLELDNDLVSKGFVLAKKVMNVIKEVYQCESVYLCTMCDGLMNHFHVQLIPRYQDEERGSKNFVKKRKEYIEDFEKVKKLREKLK